MHHPRIDRRRAFQSKHVFDLLRDYLAHYGEHVEFWIVNRASRMALGFLALMGVAPVYLTVERRPRAQ